MSDYVVAAAYSLLDLLKYLLCITVIFGIPIRKRRFLTVVWLAASDIVCLLIYILNGSQGLFFIVPNICSVFLIPFFEKRYRYRGTIFVLLTWVIMDSLSELIRLMLAIIGDRNDYLLGVVSANTILDNILVLFIPLLYYIIINFIVKKKVDYSLYPFQWAVILICFVGTLMIIPTLENIISGKSVDAASYVGMSISLITLLFLFIFVMVWQSRVMRKNVAMKREEIRYQYMLKTQSDYFDGLMKSNEEIRKFRHDMCAHIAALQEYASESNDKKMIEYLSNMEEKVNVTRVKKYTGNKAVDAVINDLLRTMDEKNIVFKYEGICRKREEINDFDLCTIFYNLLKNAIEASEKVDVQENVIQVKVKNIGDKLGISISNETILKEIPEDGVLLTTKEDKINHGLGTKSVRDVVERHDGIYTNNLIDGRFVVDIVI